MPIFVFALKTKDLQISEGPPYKNENKIKKENELSREREIILEAVGNSEEECTKRFVPYRKQEENAMVKK